MTTEAQVLRHKFLSLQVCVPKEWTPEQIKEFADKDTPCGTENGWWVTDNPLPNGDPAVVPCAEKSSTHVHRVLDA